MQAYEVEINDFLREMQEEVESAMREAGEAGVQYNIDNGDYHNRSGHLRASNFYEVQKDGLVVGNSADYADDVESRGFMVCSGGALLAEQMLNGN